MLGFVDSLPGSNEEDGLRIAPMMSSFFGEDDNTKEEDIVATILMMKDDATLATDVLGPESPKAQLLSVTATLLATMVAEEKISSFKPVVTDNKGKGPAEIEEAKKVIEDETPLGEGPFEQELRGQKYRVHQASRMTIGTKQLAKAMSFAKKTWIPCGVYNLRGWAR